MVFEYYYEYYTNNIVNMIKFIGNLFLSSQIIQDQRKYFDNKTNSRLFAMNSLRFWELSQHINNELILIFLKK